MIHAKKDELVSGYVKLRLGFVISGATHAIRGYMAGSASAGSLVDKTGALSFFYQFCGVVAEGIVLSIFRSIRGRETDWRRG